VSAQVKIRVTAVGSTDAVERAKRQARDRGLHIQTVASVRLTTHAHKHSFDPRYQQASWTVVLAVREAVPA
jgi:hypothetical protein